MPTGTQSSGNVGVWIISEHKVRRRLFAARTLHGIVIEAHIGLGNTYVVAEHSDVDIWSYAGTAHLAVLHVGKTVAEHSGAHAAVF